MEILWSPVPAMSIAPCTLLGSAQQDQVARQGSLKKVRFSCDLKDQETVWGGRDQEHGKGP